MIEKCSMCAGKGYREYFCKKNVRMMQKVCKFCKGTKKRKINNWWGF